MNKNVVRYKCSRCGSLNIGSPMHDTRVKLECLECGNQKFSRSDCKNSNNVPVYRGLRKPRNAKVIYF